MEISTFLIIVAGVFFVLLGFFPIAFYIIWTIHNAMSRKKSKKRGNSKHVKHYHISRLKELRENPRIRL